MNALSTLNDDAIPVDQSGAFQPMPHALMLETQA
jgi:hypothetical protein